MTKRSKSSGEVVYHLSTFRPEKCGIAYWTEDKINYLHDLDASLRNRVIAVNGFRQTYEYGDMVDYTFQRDDIEDYRRAAEFVNKNLEARLVWIEHEFGIFGGTHKNSLTGQESRTGSHLKAFLEEVDRPVGITLHTVLKDAEENELTLARKKVLLEVLDQVDRVVAISNMAKKILETEYEVSPDKIETIYHGVHDFKETTEQAKKILGFEDRFVLSTTGLIRKKRGMEHVIRALPEVVDKHPEVLYVIAGATHPKEVVGGIDVYRGELEREVFSRGLESNVLFVNKTLPLNSLLRYIQASDVCITPYSAPNQISSGVLSYCVGLSKPVISTPFMYAREVLGQGRGIILSDFGNSDSIAKAILGLMEDGERIERIKDNIRPFRGQMRWINVAKAYHRVERELINS